MAFFVLQLQKYWPSNFLCWGSCKGTGVFLWGHLWDSLDIYIFAPHRSFFTLPHWRHSRLVDWQPHTKSRTQVAPTRQSKKAPCGANIYLMNTSPRGPSTYYYSWDGTLYKRNSPTACHAAIQQSLFAWKLNLFTDTDFTNVKTVNSLLKQRRCDGKEEHIQHHKPINTKHWDLIQQYFANISSTTDAIKLRQYVWYQVTVHFCLHGCEIQICMRKLDPVCLGEQWCNNEVEPQFYE